MPIFFATAQKSPRRSGYSTAILAMWAVLLLFALFPAPSWAANSLSRVTGSEGPDFTRLSFTFQEPLESYVLRRDDVDTLVLDFKGVSPGRVPEIPSSPLISRIEFSKSPGGLQAVVKLASVRYELRHFLSHDQLTVALDLKSLEEENLKPAGAQNQDAPLTLPTLAEEAGRLLSQLPPLDPTDGPEMNLYRRALGRLEIMDNAGAKDDFQLLADRFPQSPWAAKAAYLLPELNFISGLPQETYAAANELWNQALNRWPDDELALRGRFMQAEADRLSGQVNEAAAKFKILADGVPEDESIYKRLALLRAADLLFSLGLIDEGRSVLEPVLERGVADRIGLESYVRAGMADFYQGFFSQANEIFLESLKLIPGLYLTYPDMLYAIGEGYHYLNRPDLSRRFLMHALNLMPDHPKADVIMARIGDNYRREGRDREAMAVYGAAKRNYPDGDGGLISQVRLAEMGALHSFFSQDKVFDALERGTRQATVEMYKKIVESGSNSPLMQLAQLKIGTALAEDGENSEAIKWLRDIEIKNPRSTLLPEALPALSRALVEEVALREELEDWKAITDLWADNSSYLSEADRTPVMRSVAEAQARLGDPEEARDIWRQMAPADPGYRLERYKKLVELSQEMGRPLDALGFIQEMANEFPEETAWMGERLSEVGRDLARPADALASANLVRMVDGISLEPARKTALADAIELDINAGRYDRALELIDRYRRDYPEDDLSKEYLLSQAEISRFVKKPQQAWAYMADFRRRYPDDPRSQSSLKEQISEADELGLIDETLNFINLYRAAYPDDPDSRLLLLSKMRKEWEAERYPDSETSFNQFRREYPADPEIPELMHQRALDDWDKGRQSQARAVWEELRRLYPDNPLAGKSYVDQYRRAVASGLTDEASEIAAEFRRLRPNDPAQAELMLEEAKDLLAAGKSREATEAWNRFREAYPQDPRNPDLLLIQARQEMKDGRNGEALRHFREILAKYPDNPRNPDIYLELAAAETNLNHRAEARGHLDQFNRRYRNHPARPKAMLDQAELGRQLGLTDEAVGIYRRFRQEYPQAPEVPSTYLAQARLELGAGRMQPAIEALEEGILTYPELDNDPTVQGLLTELYLEDGQVEKWAANVERGLKADSSASPSERFFKYNQLAQVYQKLGRNEDAARNFEAALTARPANLSPESLYAIAKAFQDMNLIEKYVEVLNILAASNDALWKGVAEKELGEVGSL